MSKLLIALEGNIRAKREQWAAASAQSEDYRRALGIEPDVIAKMDQENISLVFVLPDHIGTARLVASHVCTPESDGRASFREDTPGWERVLQVMISGSDQYSSGGGTTHFVTTPLELHPVVVELLEKERYEIAFDRY